MKYKLVREDISTDSKMTNNQSDHKIHCPNSDTLRVKGDNCETGLDTGVTGINQGHSSSINLAHPPQNSEFHGTNRDTKWLT